MPKRQLTYMSLDNIVFRLVRTEYGGNYEKFAEVAPWKHSGNTTAGCAAQLADFLNAFEAMTGSEAAGAIAKGRSFQGWEAKLRSSKEHQRLAERDRNER